PRGRDANAARRLGPVAGAVDAVGRAGDDGPAVPVAVLGAAAGGPRLAWRADRLPGRRGGEPASAAGRTPGAHAFGGTRRAAPPRGAAAGRAPRPPDAAPRVVPVGRAVVRPVGVRPVGAGARPGDGGVRARADRAGAAGAAAPAAVQRARAGAAPVPAAVRLRRGAVPGGPERPSSAFWRPVLHRGVPGGRSRPERPVRARWKPSPPLRSLAADPLGGRGRARRGGDMCRRKASA